MFMIVGFVSNWKLIKGFYKISDCQKKGSYGPKIRYSTVCRVVPLPLWICKSTYGSGKVPMGNPKIIIEFCFCSEMFEYFCVSDRLTRINMVIRATIYFSSLLASSVQIERVMTRLVDAHGCPSCPFHCPLICRTHHHCHHHHHRHRHHHHRHHSNWHKGSCIY